MIWGTGLWDLDTFTKQIAAGEAMMAATGYRYLQPTHMNLDVASLESVQKTAATRDRVFPFHLWQTFWSQEGICVSPGGRMMQSRRGPSLG